MAKYFLGLDIGTTSCGWAVTDEDYNILRARNGGRGKKMWGVRLYEEAQTAADRRGYRTNRRRLDRRKLKIMWLNEIFAPEIAKVDPKFLERLKYSALFLDDKEKFGVKNKFSLFNDSGFTDKEYFKKFKTPYHLREHLLKEPAEDIRFLYLAIHNIIKRRGHFLSEVGGTLDGDLTANINEAITLLKEMGLDNSFSLESISNAETDELCKVLSEKKGKRQTKQGFEKIFNAKTRTEKDFCASLVDGVVNIAQLFAEKGAEKIDLNDEKAEEKIFALEQSFGENAVSFLQKISGIYSNLQLKLLLGEKDYICEAMVEKFKMHNKQLKDFKTFIKKYYPKEYFNLFRNPNNEKIGYSQYINSDLYNGKKHVADLNIAVARDEEGFYDYVKKILEKEPIVRDEEYENKKALILLQIENKEFLPKIRSKANGALPNSLYRKELEQILKVSAKKFEFLNQKDESGLTNKEKIIEILKFRVPYFVGPISKNSNDENTAWAKRIEGQEKADYKPWTLKKIIDFNQAEDEFIQRMTNKCTYLPTEDVLPKNSILYENFRVLNELNNLVINGKKITVEQKQKIFNELFLKYSKVTAKRLKEFLVNENIVSKDEEVVIGGIDGEFANTRSTYLKFALTPNNIFTIDFVEKNLDVFEEIVKLHTIMADKSRLVKRLEKRYPNVFSKEQLNYIKGLNFSGWGRLSKRFLIELRFAKTDTGEVTTIMDELWNTNKNLQQIITDGNYTLSETLNKEKDKTLSTLLYNDVNELYCSPAVKRGVWQAVQIVKEVALVMGEMPEKLFVEVTRHDEEKGDNGRKSSRQKQLQEKLAQIKNTALLTAEEYNKLQAELESKDNSQLRSESLYLYFLQCGKCAYTGTKLNIDTLSQECDIDHIIPQALIKDDSIDNKVLVLREYNNKKQDTYPIYEKFPDWVNKQKGFWTFLLNNKLMSQSKYDRLVRTQPLTDEDLGGFIARQLVETNQSAKAVVDLLKNCFDNPRKVVFSKAKFVSEFRHPMVGDIPKSRSINDMHHAVDAYLNIVVGNIVHERFTDDPRNFYKKDHHNKDVSKNLRFMFKHTIRNQNTGKPVWYGETDINRVRKICERTDMLISRMSYEDLYNAFYDETLYKSPKNNPKTKASFAQKGNTDNPLSNIARYGGYNSLKNGYFLAIKSLDKKNNPQITIESVPVFAIRQFIGKPNYEQNILEYVAKENNLNSPEFISKIKFKSTLKLGKGEYWLGGKTGTNYILHNGNQWFCDYATTKDFKTIEKYLQMKAKGTDKALKQTDDEIIVVPPNKHGKNAQIITKSSNKSLFETMANQLKKEIYAETVIGKSFAEEVFALIERFEALPLTSQIEVIMNLVKRIKTGASLADLKLLGSKATGKIRINKNISDKKILLVKKSVTGLFEKVERIS